MPYTPKESLQFLRNLHTHYGKTIWGPLGPFDAINPTRNWVTPKYLGIDQGPIAPMIENHRSGLCWRTFMKAPEIAKTLAILADDKNHQQ